MKSGKEEVFQQKDQHKATVIALAPYAFLPAKIGGQKGIALFYKYFSKHVNVIILSVKKNDRSLAEGYTLNNSLPDSTSRYINPLLFFTVRELIKKHKATHLIIEHPYYGWLGILLKKFTGVKLVVHSHNIEALRFKSLQKWWWKIMWHYEKLTHRTADYNFFIHEDDQRYAIEHFGLPSRKCRVVTYGIEQSIVPAAKERGKAKEWVQQQHHLVPSDKILVFAGAFNYLPNEEALKIILNEINPLLQKEESFQYKIIICGPGIAQELIPGKNMIFAGFVDDIHIYYKAADVFINPVIDGGGIKTKLVEALGNNANVVSTRLGAIGVNESLCGGKLLLSDDLDWLDFTKKIIIASTITSDVPPSYFEHFFWGLSTKKAADFIQHHN
jgi:glycosyltransferase involved in cell wall biosynthesis